MARHEFSGDPQYRLPKGKVEPYRLWFEYLKVALRHPEVQVDVDLYRDWNGARDVEFENWWSDHWRKLFATKAETAVIETIEECSAALDDPRFAVVRVSLTGTKKRRMKDVEDALAGRKAPSDQVRVSLSKPQFALSARRSINFRLCAEC